MSPAGDLLVTSIIAGKLWSSHVLRWHGAEPVAAHPMGEQKEMYIYIYKVFNSKKCGPWKFDAEGV